MSVPVFDLAALRAAALFGAKAWLCLRGGPGSRRYGVPAVKASSLLLAYVDHHDKAYAWAERRLTDFSVKKVQSPSRIMDTSALYAAPLPMYTPPVPTDRCADWVPCRNDRKM